MDGIIGITPQIKKIDFSLKGKINFYLKDGRIIIVPLSYFPEIKKLNLNQRKKWQILDNNAFTFDDASEVWHIEQVLGKEQDYQFK